MADRHCRVCHCLDVRAATRLLIGDRRHSDRCSHSDLAVAQAVERSLELGDGLIAVEAGEIRGLDVDAGQDAVVVAAGDAGGEGGEDR